MFFIIDNMSFLNFLMSDRDPGSSFMNTPILFARDLKVVSGISILRGDCAISTSSLTAPSTDELMGL